MILQNFKRRESLSEIGLRQVIASGVYYGVAGRASKTQVSQAEMDQVAVESEQLAPSQCLDPSEAKRAFSSCSCVDKVIQAMVSVKVKGSIVTISCFLVVCVMIFQLESLGDLRTTAIGLWDQQVHERTNLSHFYNISNLT